MSDFQTARASIGGLKGVMTRLGDAPSHEHKWKNLPRCPFCGVKGCSGVFSRNGAEFFKCLHSSCSSGGEVLSDIRYLSMRQGLSMEKPAAGGPSPAYEAYLKMAGCWRDQTDSRQAQTSAMQERRVMDPGQQERRVGAPGLQVQEIATTMDEGLPPHADAMDDQISRDAVSASGEGLGPRRVHGSPEGGHNSGDKMFGGPSDPPQPSPSDVKPAPSSTTEQAASPAMPKPSTDCETGPEEEAGPGYRALRWFHERLTPTDCEMRPCVPPGAELSAAAARLVEFKPASLFERRGLMRETCRLLGFKANPPANEQLLLEMRSLFDWEELVDSGLWLESNRAKKLPRRPNAQYFGKGIAARKPEKERRDSDDKWHWSPHAQPVLIPYFDEDGRLVKLRPHKGGAPSGTAAGAERIYVPRITGARATNGTHAANGKDGKERFQTVIVCEGEFKAVAIWQEIGVGSVVLHRDTAAPVGVCALPGISFAKNHNYRGDLEAWLREVECRRVIVAFDDEDKSHEPLSRRFDAKKYACYLAMYLSRTLHVTGLFAPLPLEWRERGKADWDGGLVKLLNGSC